MLKKIFLIFSVSISLYADIPVIHELRDIPGELEGYHTDRWPQFFVTFYEKMTAVIHEVKEQLSTIPEGVYLSLFAKDPHSKDIAQVRYTPTDDIGDQEKAFLAKRSIVVQKQLEKLFNIPIDVNNMPRIGFVFSGGGFRAMLMTLGFLNGAEQAGILQTATYCAGLSGSTWALAPWIASKKKLPEFINELTCAIDGGVDHINDPYEISQMLEIMVTKILCNQFISSIDIYGGIISNTLLKKFSSKPMLARFTDTHEVINDGFLPMPIYTAIESAHDPYEWVEFTPYEIGGTFLKHYIPTWAYGRKFKNGQSTTFSPEQTLGYFMGVFGSAFELSIKDIIRLVANDLAATNYQLPKLIASTVKKALALLLDSSVAKARPFPSMLPNFSYELEASPMNQTKKLQLIDAGIDFNLPFPPLLREARNVNIIIVCDSSATVIGAPELRRAELYARRCGLKFPQIDYSVVDVKHISVWFDEHDLSVPVIVYIPRLKHETFPVEFDPEDCIKNSFCNTFNFAYSKEQARLLCGLTRFIITAEQSTIKDAIGYVLNKVYNYPVNVNPHLKPGYVCAHDHDDQDAHTYA